MASAFPRRLGQIMKMYRVTAGLCLWAVFIAMGEGQTSIDLRTQSKSVDFSGATATKPMQTGSSLPTTCAVGQFFFLTTATAGSNVYACNPANTWATQGNSVPMTPGSANEVLSSNGSSTQWLAVGGDVSGPPGALTVSRFQGRNLSNAAPSSQQVLQWNASLNQWQPAPAQAGNSSYAFAAQVTVTIPGTVHQFETANLVVDCYDNSLPPQRVEPDKVQISPTNYNVTVDFSTPQTGYCVVNGAGTASVGGSGGGGAISSVFGRTGAIAAQSGDYAFGLISGSVASTQLPSAGGDVSGILTAATVSGIQNRPVSNAAPSNGQALVWNASASAWQPATVSGSGGAVGSVFGRTGVVTAQSGDYGFSQISGTVSSAQLPSAGGDLGGTLTSAAVKAIQGEAVASTAPGNGQVLVWNTSANMWQPSSISGAGGGVTMASQLGDLGVVRTSATVLTIGAGCAPTSPCNVRFGYQVFSITTSATATLSGSALGEAFVYVSSIGILTIGHNLTIACSSECVQQSGITSFPANVLPIATWTATAGTWDTTGGSDERAFLSAKTLSAGQGIVLTEAPGLSTIAVDNGVIPTYLMNSAPLVFPNISTGTCAADQALTVAGANPGDAVAPGWPVLPIGVFGTMFVSATNVVTVRLCNLSGFGMTPPNASYRATIVRNY